MPITVDEIEVLEHATLEELEQRLELAEWEKIEDFEARASEKAIRFQSAFFARKDTTGRKCSKFIAIGGNRSSKTITCARLCFAKYLRDVARSGDHFWAGSQNLLRSIAGLQKELWEALPAGIFRGRIWDSKLGFGGNRTIQLRTRDGGTCTVEFRSADQDLNTFETAKLRGVIWDENLPEPLYNRLLPRLIDLDGFFLYSDINNQWWPIERLENAPLDAGVYYQNFSMYDNELNLPPGAIAQFAAGLTTEEKELRILGKAGAMEGLVYKEYRDLLKPDGNLCKRFRIPEEWPKWRLIDYGGSAPTACAWVAMSPSEILYVYRQHYEKGLNVERNANMIIAASEDDRFLTGDGILLSGNAAYRQTFMDPHAVDKPPAYYGASPSVADQYEAAGIASTGWPFINVMGEHALVQRVKFRLEHRTLFVFEDLIDLRREFKSWKYQTDKDGKPVAKDVYENDNNHLLDCLKGFLGTNPCFTDGMIKERD